MPPEAHTPIPITGQDLPLSHTIERSLPLPLTGPGPKLLEINLRKQRANKQTVSVMFGVTAPKTIKFQRKHKQMGAAVVGNSNDRIPPNRVMRTLLGKGEGVGKDYIRFP